MVPDALASNRPDPVPAPWLTPGDWDGFFALFFDNLLQLMLIAVLCPTVCGIPSDYVVRVILPGAAVSILFGNLAYAWQARRLMARTGRRDVTALPYGLAISSLVSNIYLIMGPVYVASHDWRLAYHVGLFACFLRSALEVGAAFFGSWIRRHTPRAALLSPLAGIALVYVSLGFVLEIFQQPVLTIVPLFILLVGYTPGVRLPFRLPAGLLAIAFGTAVAWGLHGTGLVHFDPPPAGPLSWSMPRPVPVMDFIFSRPGLKYLAVILPIALMQMVESLQILESAEANGDAYDTRASLVTNGLGGIVAAAFGSCFPTNLYLGHPAWKQMGARSGYSVLNGAAITLLCLCGGITWILSIVPLQPSMAILMWVGLAMTAQAFTGVPSRHAPAVVLGLLPLLAQWGLGILKSTAAAAGVPVASLLDRFGDDFAVRGLIGLSQGSLVSSMLLTAILVHIIERRFDRAALWALLASVFSAIGLIHAFRVAPEGIVAVFGCLASPGFALSYMAVAVMLGAFHWYRRNLVEP
jgi:AGZA family xanthine/uracil permease-like MFS transporter